MPGKSSNIKNEKQYEALKDKGMSKQRAARIANSEGASARGGEKSGSGGDSRRAARVAPRDVGQADARGAACAALAWHRAAARAATVAARSLDIPLSLRASYCFSFLTFEDLLAMASSSIRGID